VEIFDRELVVRPSIVDGQQMVYAQVDNISVNLPPAVAEVFGSLLVQYAQTIGAQALNKRGIQGIKSAEAFGKPGITVKDK
jgi:hypothetical protein